ncbi:protein Dek isoform X2 [Leptinotarsa decemlineata]|uniref:protein Dek isoform X2 n=1 Tax=Leptinotarsa decemlineata TaxID=7539 RepID=UPI003D30A6F1
MLTVAMSSEGDSSKSVISESNEKSGTDNNTDDSSQDSHDVNDIKAAKASDAPTENNLESKDEEEKSKEEIEEEDKSSEKSPEKVDKANSDKKEKGDSEDDEDEEEDDVESEEVDGGEKEDKSKKDKDEKNKKGSEKTKKEKEKKAKGESKSEDNSEREDGESEKDDKDGDKEVPLLDQPLEKSGKRERKGVQRFNEEFNAEPKEGAKVEFVEGTGTPLGDIPRVDASISRFKNDDLKFLHRLLFKVIGKNTLIKKNIRKFNGFDFKKDSEEYEKKVAFAGKFEVKQLKSMCEMLDLPKSGVRDEIAQRIVDFLVEPKDSGKPVDGGRPKRSAAVKANNRGKRPNLKEDSSSDEEFKPNLSDGSEKKSRTKRKRGAQKKKSSEEEEVSDPSIASSDESDDEPKSKRKKSPVKANNKSKAKATPARKGRASAPAKKTPSRGRKSKAKAESSDEEESEHKEEASSSEDEPLVKKAKSSQPPTDDEIKTFIKSILEGANLEEITMKTVCQRVYDHYPDFDLTQKKDFIKTTVKSLIST